MEIFLSSTFILLQITSYSVLSEIFIGYREWLWLCLCGIVVLPGKSQTERGDKLWKQPYSASSMKKEISANPLARRQRHTCLRGKAKGAAHRLWQAKTRFLTVRRAKHQPAGNHDCDPHEPHHRWGDFTRARAMPCTPCRCGFSPFYEIGNRPGKLTISILSELW